MAAYAEVSLSDMMDAVFSGHNKATTVEEITPFQ